MYIMNENKIELRYNGWTTTLDLRRVVAITKPIDGKFLIYFENAIWTVGESQFEHVYNAWMKL